MAYANTRYAYPHTQTEAELNRKPPSYFDENDPSMLESAILNADVMQGAENGPMRKGSFASNAGVISPAQPHAWAHAYPGGLPVDHVAAGPSQPFLEDQSRFVREPASQLSTFAHHPIPPPPPPGPSNWTYEQHSGDCTPTTRMDFEHPPPPGPFDAPAYVHHRTDSARGSFSHAPPRTTYNGPEEIFIPAPQVQTPMSPHSHQDWMSMAAHEVECRPMSRRMRGHTPPQTAVDFQRRDGIRKKNARIDIPQERSIHTIEQLLESTTDEDLLKELKQQKRLLRNREAALASRQRKKKHTEDLELREKEFGRTLDGLQGQIEAVQLERQNQDRNYQILSHRFQEAQRIIDSLHEEKRDMMMKHTEETSSLRKRIRVLTDQLDHGPAPIMSAGASSTGTGFADFNAEMEALNMGTHDWDNLIFDDLQNESLEEMGFEIKPEAMRQAPSEERTEISTMTVSTTPRKSNDSTSDQHVASGLLFFLLLCGAFVASKPSSSQPADLPQMPADVRAAAPTVLHSLLSESQVPATPANARTPRVAGSEPGPSALPLTPAKSRSKLDRIHHRLTAPTRQQEIDSAFSLTTAEYASITNMDYLENDDRPSSSHHEDTPPRPRRILAETLASMQEEHTRTSKAEVYTRSLLWDQIPADVVKQFKEMVRDHNEIETRQHQRQNNDETTAFKVE